MESNLLRKNSRIDVVDALRGFAVMAILIVHSIEHFIFPVYPNPAECPAWLNILDQGTFDIIFALFAGKSYAIFSILFGFTFYIQYTNQQKKGKDFGYRFLWRLLLLAGFATINAAFFPAGDVLLLYSVVGITLFIVRKWSNKAVFIAALILLLQPIEWYNYFRSLTDNSYTIPDLAVGAMYQEIEKITKEGDFFKFILTNVTLGQKASFMWAVGAGRFLQTAGLFMLGMLIGRKEYFISSEKNTCFWIKILITTAISFAPLYVLKIATYDNAESDLIKNTVGVVLDMWQKLAFTFILVSSFYLLYQNRIFRDKTSRFNLYGRMSLTNYITQSMLGAFVYFPFGLYLAPYTGYFLSFLVGIGIVIVQLFFCNRWFRSHKQGPFEKLWHKLTWINNK